MNKSKITDLLIFLILILAGASQAQSGIPSAVDLVSFEQASAPVISANGKLTAFVIRKPGPDFLAWEQSLYLLDNASGIYTRFTAPGSNNHSPVFSPDGAFLYFLSNRSYRDSGGKNISGKTALWRASLNGGEPTLLTELPRDAEEYAVSKNGTTVAILCSGDEEDKPFSSGGKSIKSDEMVFPLKNPAKWLYFINVSDLKVSDGIKLDAGAERINISPDGKTVVYQSSKTGEYNDEDKIDLYSVDKSGKITPLVTTAGPETSAQFSPDGKSIAFLSRTVPDIEFAEIDLNIIDASGKERKLLTGTFNLSVSSFAWKDNNEIIFTAVEKTTVPAYLLEIKNNKISKISEPGHSISDISVSDNGQVLWRAESATTLQEIYRDGKRLTHFSTQTDSFKTGTQEEVVYKSKDGKFELNGVVFKPADFNPAKQYPLILTIHGGPYGYFRNSYNQIYPVKMFTAMGYVVFAPNPRGSLGGSDEFGQANRYDLGGGDYTDIIDGVDMLIKKGYIDENRMGVMGGSYGGYLTNWTISQTNRIKAAVSLYGIFSFLTDWSNSWQPAFEKMYFGYYYWEKPIDMNNLYINRSPAFHVTKIKTPTLILQGEKDKYTDVANSREMYQALNTIGIPVEFVLYPGEGHGIRNKPYHYINVLERTVGWFEKYLK